MEKNKQLFYDKLKDIFIGAKIEGNSGFINLMRIKSSYFHVVFTELNKEINEKTKLFPDFKEEMFDKLYTFFNTYFSESGSIYFTYTPLKSKIYDKIYTNQDDVILFWKTRMLYYVKTDKIWNNLKVEYTKEGITYNIIFDVSNLEHKSGNEKRDIIYELGKIESKNITFRVLYSEKGKVTKTDEILREFKKDKIYLNDEDLDRIFKIFEKQNEVDYFINKNAKEFLKEQFDLWLKNYVFDDETDFSEKRLKELKLLKEIAYKVIDFVSQFEDELVKIWNKPKFVLNSNYVITLDRIANKKDGIDVIKKILNHKGIEEQIKEWKELNIIDENFNKKEIIQKGLNERLNDKYKFLPIDTKYFKDLELDILSLFDNLDNELDGWLIHSENYQALNTILPKFKEKIQTIYIDPPFNLGTNADFLYNVNYKDSTWATMLQNRISLAKDLLKDTGSIFVRCDYNGNWIVRPLMNEIFGEENFRNEIVVKRMTKLTGTTGSLDVAIDSLFLFSKSQQVLIKQIQRDRICKYCKQPKEAEWVPLEAPGEGKNNLVIINGKKFYARKNSHWTFKQELVDEMLKKGLARINESRSYIDKFGNRVYGLPEYLQYPFQEVDNDWTDIPGYSRNWDFQTENSEILLKRVIESTSNENDLVMDFFLGSGTTIAVEHKLKRKWIGIEIGKHFNSVILPRMKKVLAYDKSGISKEKDVKDKYNENNAGGFFKYYELEQYEQTLRKCHYIPSEPFFDLNDKSIYKQYVFLKDPKLLDAMELDYKNNKIKINFNDIYPNIDIAETLSLIRGKKIKKIERKAITLIDDSGNEEKIDYDNINFKIIKPLIWW
jgi:adenine specific DNA methylase Mod